MNETEYFGVFREEKVLFTKMLGDKNIFKDDIVEKEGIKYYRFDETRSKLSAVMHKGIKPFELQEQTIVLYLGAAHGYTVSHLSNIVSKGMIFAVEPALKVARHLFYMAQSRSNVSPLVVDANQPREYISNICAVDFVYQDIAQKNQAEIFLHNTRLFLVKGGTAVLCVKARSIDVQGVPKKIYSEIKKSLQKELDIVTIKDLEPYYKDHCMFVCRKPS